MLDVFVAAASWLLVGWFPGYALLSALRPDSAAFENAAIGSLASVGAIMFVAEAAQLMGIPILPWIVLPIAAVGCLTPAALVHRHRRLFGYGWVRSRFDRYAVVTAIAIGVLVWCLIISSPNAVLPGTDGAHHGLYAFRIEHYSTLDSSKILAGDTSTGRPFFAYYPLAIHVTAALIAGATAVPVSTALTVALVMSAAILLPTGMYLLVSRLCSIPRAGAIAAVMSVSVPWFPYEPIVWGGLPTIVGICQVPGLITALTRTGRLRSIAREAIAIALCSYGLFAEHNTEVVTTVIICGVLLPPALARLERRQRMRWISAYVIGGALFIFALAPQLPAIVKGAAASSGQFKLHGTILSGQRVVPMISQHDVAVALGLTLMPLVVLAIATSHRYAWATGWGWASIGLLAIFALTFSHNTVATVITSPWYATPLRATYQLVPVAVAYGAAGLAGLFADLRELYRTTRPWPVRAIATAGLAACVMLGFAALPDTVPVGNRGYRDSSLVGSDQLAGFAWLKTHVPTGARVLNDFNDGSGWMEVFAGVHPVFGARVDSTNLAAWGDRGYLLTHASRLANDTRAQAAVHHWNVQYVYFNAKYFDGNPELLAIDDLRGSPAYQLVWHRGDVSIFKIELAKRA